MGLFFTGKGDQGQSDLGGKKIDKSSPEIAAVGALDEINSLLGLIRTQDLPHGYAEIIAEAQENLFTIQAHIGCFMMNSKPPDFPEGKVRNMEEQIDEFERRTEPQRGFVISGETAASAWLDYARTVARRAELSILMLQKLGNARPSFNPHILAYMNRLSSLLYAMARFAAKTEEKKEKHPRYDNP